MAKFDLTGGFTAYTQILQSLEVSTRDVAKAAVYEGSKIIADQIREEIHEIPEVKNNQHGTPDSLLFGVTKQQKKGLEDGLGIAKQWEDEPGKIETKVGIVGYNSLKTKKYPKGQPNPLIARSVIRGTSFRKKYDFVSKAIKKASEKAEEKMAEVIEQKIYEITE